MDEITATVLKITAGIKSEAVAKEEVARFFKTHDHDTNWELIDALCEFVEKNPIGRRAQRKILSVQHEILNYLRDGISTDETDDWHNHIEEIFGEYDYILQNAIMACLNNRTNIDLIFLPLFYIYPSALLALNNAGIKTLNELLACDQERLVEVLKEDGDAMTTLVMFFDSLEVKLNVPRG